MCRIRAGTNEPRFFILWGRADSLNPPEALFSAAAVCQYCGGYKFAKTETGKDNADSKQEFLHHH